MKKLLTKTLLAVSLLGIGFAFVNLNDYAGLPSEHGPSKLSYKYELAGLPSEHSPMKLSSTIELAGLPSEHSQIKLMGLPSEH
ncbi:hypothetical protein ABE096_07120 [Robertmurraya massiliosenegalensis]|uniref:hypothetical protein n=1 Tax=Robertmurraya TaxID=2837507 RepID=UPI0039A67353